MLLGGKALGLGFPSLRGKNSFGREKGSCFVWVPKPKACWGSRGRGFPEGLRPFQAPQGRRD